MPLKKRQWRQNMWGGEIRCNFDWLRLPLWQPARVAEVTQENTDVGFAPKGPVFGVHIFVKVKDDAKYQVKFRYSWISNLRLNEFICSHVMIVTHHESLLRYKEERVTAWISPTTILSTSQMILMVVTSSNLNRIKVRFIHVWDLNFM